jgi:NAD(P)-dependent dehydrogenase (short-subunit alcohol dehydrogenase family)
MSTLSHRAAIVTGAARGLGREMALALASAGVSVLAVDLADSLHELNEVVRSSVGRGISAETIVSAVADVTSPTDCIRAVDVAIQQFGAVHALVNNAAIGMQNLGPVLSKNRKRFFEVPDLYWKLAFDVNVNGPFNMTRALAPSLISQGFGRIINLVTSYSTMQDFGFSPYGPTKAALEAATVVWAKDLQGSGVTVNALLPGGPADTRMIPLSDNVDRSRLLRPEIMGPPIVWLVTEAGDDVTGWRFIAADWDVTIDPFNAALRAGAPAGWYQASQPQPFPSHQSASPP